MGDTLQAPMSRKAIRKAKKAHVKAVAQAQKAAAEEAAEEAALQAAVEAAQRANLKTATITKSDTRTKKDENPRRAHLTETPEDTIPAVVATITVNNGDKTSEKPKEDSTAAPTPSTKLRKRSRRRRSRKSKNAPAQPVEHERASDEQVEKPSDSAENAVFTEMLQNSHLDWVENQAYRVYYETSADGRKAAFVYDGALTPFQKISCALESIDLSTMEKDDGPHPPTEFDHQLRWVWLPHMSDGCFYAARMCYRQYSKNIQPVPCYQVQCRGASGMENGDFYTFLGDGTPFHQHIDFCEHYDTKRPKFETARQEEKFEQQDKQQLVHAKSMKIGPDRNPLSQSLSSLRESGFVYRGKPRVLERLVHAYCGKVDGEDVWAPLYTSTILAYKSYYRVASNSTREQYCYGGEHFFYPSGRRCSAYVNFEVDFPSGIVGIDEFRQ